MAKPKRLHQHGFIEVEHCCRNPVGVAAIIAAIPKVAEYSNLGLWASTPTELYSTDTVWEIKSGDLFDGVEQSLLGPHIRSTASSVSRSNAVQLILSTVSREWKNTTFPKDMSDDGARISTWYILALEWAS